MKHALIDLASQLERRIVFLQETTSTNDLAVRGEYAHGDVIVAERQTKGRGRKNRHWQSESGKNLTFSVVLEPSFLAADHQFLLSEIVSLALIDMLDSYGIDAQIKWTNDIYINGLKVAGILIENDILGADLARSVVGIGININQTSFSDDIPNPVSMRLASGYDFDRVEVLERFLVALGSRYNSLSQGHFEAIQSDYHTHLYMLNLEHGYELPDKRLFRGTMRRVEPSGELVVEHPNGRQERYLFDEINLCREP